MNHPPRSTPADITMGCPAGVGPEIIVKAFAKNPKWGRERRCVVLGSRKRLEETASLLGIDACFHEWDPVASGSREHKCDHRTVIPVLDIRTPGDSTFEWGRANGETGLASMKYLTRAIDLALKKRIHAIVTAPLSKHGLKMAGIDFPGHTEILAERTGTGHYAMMLAGSQLRVVLATIHCPLKEVSSRLSVLSVLDTIKITHDSLEKRFRISKPDILVAGLNPHAGEEGMFGTEEKTIIKPAVKMALEQGMNVSGPWPPDTLFYKAVNSGADAVVCMYHDQGLIPFKLLHFRDGVNITLGLPIIRTSVDHGTAYDIAGKGIAGTESLEEAVRMAHSMEV